jgi:protein gp37
MKMAGRLEAMGSPIYRGHTVKTKAGFVWNGKVSESNWGQMIKPLSWKRPRRIFACSMSDLFHEALPDEAIDRVFAVMALCPQHTFQVLTKRPERMRRYLSQAQGNIWDAMMGLPSRRVNYVVMRDGNPVIQAAPGWPLPNVWLGVSVEDQQRADERIPLLLETPAAKRFLSCEPLLGPVDLWPKLIGGVNVPGLDWVIVGGESGKGARPMHPDWARSLRDQCQAAGVPFFFKQWGSCLPCSWDGEDEHGNTGCYIIDEEHSSIDYDVLGRAMHASIPGVSRDFARFGHKNTGRSLDGREWSEFPGMTIGRRAMTKRKAMRPMMAMKPSKAQIAWLEKVRNTLLMRFVQPAAWSTIAACERAGWTKVDGGGETRLTALGRTVLGDQP